MWLKLNLEGLEVWFRIRSYEPSDNGRWDYQWCEIGFNFQFGDIINYGKDTDEVLLSCEIENIKEDINDCLNDKIEEKRVLEFIEPDFKFIFYPKHFVIDEPNVIQAPADVIVDVHAEWRIYLWDGGLTDNYFSTTLDRENLIVLQTYLKFVTGEFKLDSPQVQKLISDGKLVKKYILGS